MKTLEDGQKKIKQISDILRNEVLEPAKEKAKHMIEEGRLKAEGLVLKAEEEIQGKKEASKLAMEQEYNVFMSSLEQASKQSLESLKQEIEKKFFNDSLQEILSQQLTNPQVIANLINALIQSVLKEGEHAELEAVVPKTVNPREVNQLLIENYLQKLNGESVQVGEFSGGVCLKVVNKKMTLEVTDNALKEMLVNHIRKDFRKLVFGK